MTDPVRDADGLLPPRAGDVVAATQALVTALRRALAPQAVPPPQPADGVVPAAAVPSRDVVEMARRHRVGTLLLGVADAAGLDADDVAVLRADRTREVHQAMVVQAATVHVLGALDRAEVPALVYKGVALAARTTGDPTARGGGDVDLLVHPDDVEAAHRTLLAADCTFHASYSPAPGSELWPVARYVNPELPYWWRGVSIDLHWRVDLAPQAFAVPFDALWQRRTEVRLTGHHVPTLDDIDALLVTAVHGTKERWRRLRWVVDVVRQAAAVPEDAWPDVLARARASGSEASLGIALHMAEQLMGAPVAPVSAGPLARQWGEQGWALMLADAVVGSSFSWQGGLARARWWWGTVPPGAARWRRVATYVLPAEDLVLLPLPRALVPLYLPLRPVLRRRRAQRKAVG